MSKVKSANAASRAAAVDRSGTAPVAYGCRAGASLRRGAAGAAGGERDLLRGGLRATTGPGAEPAAEPHEPAGVERPLAVAHPHTGAGAAPLAKGSTRHIANGYGWGGVGT